MTDNQEQARTEAEDAAAKVPKLLAQVAEKLGANVGASAVFGEAVEQDGRTVVPVAQSMIGTGAGGGSGTEGQGSGVGAGGGAIAKPVGYIEVTAEGAAFVPLSPPWADPDRRCRRIGNNHDSPLPVVRPRCFGSHQR